MPATRSPSARGWWTSAPRPRAPNGASCSATTPATTSTASSSTSLTAAASSSAGRGSSADLPVPRELLCHAPHLGLAEDRGLQPGREQREILAGEVLDLGRDRVRPFERRAERDDAVVREQHRLAVLEAAHRVVG